MVFLRDARLAAIGLAWLLALAWLRRSITALRGMRTMLDLTALDPAVLPELPESEAPHLTVIVPARDEAACIESTLRSLFASTGIRLQIVAVDDRSTDGTAKLMDKIDVESPTGLHQFEVIHIRELPSRWLGKPHALSQGAERARASWLLFTDGDVLFAPRALELALRTALREQADHFVLVPTLIRRTLGEAAIQATTQVLGQWVARMWKVGDAKARDAFGVGGFNLVRADALHALGGMLRLRMEVVEDVALGWLVKHELHRRSVMVLGPGLVQIRWIQGTFGIVRLLAKNGFAGLRYSVGRSLGICLGLALQAVLPLIALALFPWGTAASVLFYSGVAFGIYANRKLSHASPLLAVFFAPSALILGWAFLRSMLLTLSRKGIEWRGTFYPLQELRGNMLQFLLMR